MAFRCIMVENPAYLSIRSHQLVIRTDTEHSMPIEDISALLLESRGSTITTAALSALGQCGCAVFTCDETHMPCTVTLPYMQHCRESAVLQNQLAMSVPQKKRLWQSIVRAKISNQAACLRLTAGCDGWEALFAMAGRVRSGDTENVEAVAAQLYFPLLFGADFIRGDENGINAGLNYGYAILRGCIARSLAVYGFLPAFGLHHRSTCNSFNLADDLIEPFRPVVDQLVYRSMARDDALLPEKKRLLFNCLNLDIRSGGQHHSVAYAIERLVQSLSRASAAGEGELCLPELLLPAQHQYE